MQKYLLLLSCVLLSCHCHSQEKHKFQLWNANSASVALSQKNTLQVAGKVYYCPKTNTVDMKFADLWFKHQACAWFRYGGGIRFNYMKKEPGYKAEQRLMAISEFTKPIKKVKVSFTGRFSYRIIEQTDNCFQFWQKLNISFPPLSKYKIKFFTSEESFTKLTPDNLWLARLHAGFVPFSKGHFQVKAYYAFEKKKSSGIWKPTDIVGVNMYLNL